MDVEAITKQHVADGKVLEGMASRQAEVGKAVDKVRCRFNLIWPKSPLIDLKFT